jgi:hypothetical protein
MNSSVIVYDFNIERVAALKPKAHPPLIVYADAVLPCTAALKSLKAV